MTACFVNVATGAHYIRGQRRLREAVEARGHTLLCWTDCLPPESPSHSDKPYAFKAAAMREAQRQGHRIVIWADSCMLPIRDMTPLVEKIERDGYYICNNGFANASWTADHAYADLGVTREQNWQIKHCVAGLIGLDLQSDIGKVFLDEYERLAHTSAFRGPTWNSRCPKHAAKVGAYPCGPAEVEGHRHDQTAASVIAWRLGMELTDPPKYFCYRGGETEDTVIVADGAY